MNQLSTAIVLLLSSLFNQISAGTFSSKGDVQSTDAARLKKHVAASSKGTMVAFYAPWCGHCKNLAPEFEKAATNLKDLVTFVAVDCDADVNKAACQTDYQVRGFPTLMYFAGLPVPKPYQGERKAKAMVDFSLESMPNFVKRTKTADDLGKLVSKSSSSRPLVVLFTEATKTTPLFKALSSVIHKKMDVHTVSPIGTLKETLKEKYDVEKFPTLVIFTGDQKSDRTVYSGKMNYKDIFAFFKSHVPSKEQPKKENTGKASGEL